MKVQRNKSVKLRHKLRNLLVAVSKLGYNFVYSTFVSSVHLNVNVNGHLAIDSGEYMNE